MREGGDLVVVRLALPDDAPAIAAVHARTWQVAYRGHLPDAFLDDLTPATRLPFWERMLSAMAAPWATFVAEDGGGVVGFCSVGPSRVARTPDAEPAYAQTGEVYSIYVLPGHQGKGGGRLLLDRACDAMRDAGFVDAILWVLAGNAPAIAFYERMGWWEDGQARQETIAGVTIDERRYRRFLGAPRAS